MSVHCVGSLTEKVYTTVTTLGMHSGRMLPNGLDHVPNDFTNDASCPITLDAQGMYLIHCGTQWMRFRS
ncbi:hypothetical protein QR680_000268 [Steinernema hermaphroditum]|uniref:Uncharacterized protein n=1 Tax=Steinernema hermaphroditum TaxID=289476 RepID=A0AA39GWS3_9BILA|nr:hypothetical protein QR680_000268 [Steinernema hermaphroditum]